MAVLRDDVYARRRLPETAGHRTGVAMFLLALLSLALLVISRIEHPLVRAAQNQAAELAAPLLRALAVPLLPFRRLGSQVAEYRELTAELERTRLEVQRLKGWEARAIELERRLSDLGALARVVDEPGLPFITARVIADVRSPFARTILLNSGREQGIKPGYPVMSSDGLVGRIVDTGERTSRILMLSDVNSRVPVLVGPAGVRGVLLGTNGEMLRLAHLPEDTRLEAGFAVISSGVGGIFPRGLRIGEVVDSDRGPQVRLHARLSALEHVSVLFYETSSLDMAGEAPRAAPQRRSPPRRPLDAERDKPKP